MADPTEDPQYNAAGVRQVHSGTPGISGAIGDMIAALAQAFAPRGLTQRGPMINQTVDQQAGPPSDLASQLAQ